jgi:signal peptidase II
VHVLQAKGRATLTPSDKISVQRRIAVSAFLVFLLDFVSKAIAIQFLPDHPVPIIGSLLQLNLQFNSGAAFSLGTSKTVWLSALAVGAVALIFYYGNKVTNQSWALALGIALGGILGNFSDRLFRQPGFLSGQVVDWIELPHWPTFNIADSSIVISAIIVVILSVRNIKPIGPDAPPPQF